MTHPADGRVLIGRLGERATLQKPSMPQVPGTIGAMTDDYVEFALENGKTLNMAFRSLELKYAVITAQ
jgi:hypothetical protein